MRNTGFLTVIYRLCQHKKLEINFTAFKLELVIVLL